jgi:hypothetical protein
VRQDGQELLEKRAMTMIDWAFVFFAAIGGALFFIRLALFFMGGDADADVDVDVDIDVDMDVDMDVDGADGVDGAHGADGMDDSDVSFKVLSLQTVTAFLMMFGLTGLALRREAYLAEGWSVLGSLVVGTIALLIVAKLMSWMKGMKSDGTMVMANAVGQDGSVYLTIREGGIGKVRVTVQGHLKVFNAAAKDGKEVKTGERVTVLEVTPDNTLIVAKQ